MPVSGFEPEKHSPFWNVVVRRGMMQCFSSRPTDKKIKMLEQDSWLPVNLNQNRIVQSQPQLLATQLLYGREEWLPPNWYSHQVLNNDLSVSYEAMDWPTHAFSTLCLFWPLTAPVAFQRTNVCFMGRLPIYSAIKHLY